MKKTLVWFNKCDNLHTRDIQVQKNTIPIKIIFAYIFIFILINLYIFMKIL